MIATNLRAKKPGFLARLRQDETGNVIAMTAAAVLPMIAIVGGAIDVSRLYGVQSRLQAACDAGALTGRRVMGSAAWGTTSENAANAMFSTNFANNYFGGTSLVKDFDGVDGRVNGEVSVNVPMTLMRMFGQEERTVSVTCTSEMRIPHTDVMFVLDTTGSMAFAPDGTTASGTNPSRMAGLRRSVNCFFETLAKEDTGEICAASGTDPVATGLASGIQLRVGFMPYSSNINVGKLLPTAYFADTWAYQSRTPVIANINVWEIAGTETNSPYVYSARPTPSPNIYASASSYSATWTDLGTSGQTVVQRFGATSVTLDNVKSAATSAACVAFNDRDSNRLLSTVGDSMGTPGTYTPGSYVAPNYSGSATGTVTRPHTQPMTNNLVRGYRYAWVSNTCRLQISNGRTSSPNTRWNGTRTWTGTTAINWTTQREVTGWTLQQRNVDVSGLKNGTNWNASFTVPDFTTSTANVRKSGSSVPTTINTPANAGISWNGCIEERQTYMNVDNNPDDEWSPIPNSALDLDINTAPTSADNSKWAPALEGLIYQRTVGGTRTMDPVSTAAAGDVGKLNFLACPTEARRLEVYKTGATRTPSDIRAYTNSLVATGATYHDIGLLWGARFMSPTGIFGTANSTDSSGNAITIQRHMIFMTDGDTGTCSFSYSPYGTAWWDRRQTNKDDPADDGGPTCTNSYTNRIVDARTAALCNAIKNMNITLWVVSFGSGVNATSEARLRTCASSANHFYDADNTAALMTAFNEIALQISRLRLQS